MLKKSNIRDEEALKAQAYLERRKEKYDTHWKTLLESAEQKDIQQEKQQEIQNENLMQHILSKTPSIRHPVQSPIAPKRMENFEPMNPLLFDNNPNGYIQVSNSHEE